MKIEELSQEFAKLYLPAESQSIHPTRASVAAMRDAIAHLLQSEEFMLQCVALELARLRRGQLTWGLPPFFIQPECGARWAFGYWPPGGSAGPHEHTAWTITGVWKNRLEVVTYDRSKTYAEGRPVQKNRFDARAGEVGYISEPCIHAPHNPTRAWSLTLHVTSPRDGEADPATARPLACLSRPGSQRPFEGHPYGAVVHRARLQAFSHQLARALSTMTGPAARELLIECALWGGIQVREFAAHALNGNAPNPVPRRMQRTHPQLALSCADRFGIVALGVDTPQGVVTAFELDAEWKTTIQFIADVDCFEVDALPGGLSPEEKWEIATILDKSGLFAEVERP